MLPDRHNDIMETLRRDGTVSVEALAQRFGVTQQTIRKDLNDLGQRRLLARTHGGADQCTHERIGEICREGATRPLKIWGACCSTWRLWAYPVSRWTVFTTIRSKIPR